MAKKRNKSIRFYYNDRLINEISITDSADQFTESFELYQTIQIAKGYGVNRIDYVNYTTEEFEKIASALGNLIGSGKSISHQLVSEDEEPDYLEPYTVKKVFDLSVSERSSITLDQLDLHIDPGTAPPEEVARLLAALSIAYRKLGGSGITFKPEGVLRVHEEEVV